MMQGVAKPCTAHLVLGVVKVQTFKLETFKLKSYHLTRRPFLQELPSGFEYVDHKNYLSSPKERVVVGTPDLEEDRCRTCEHPLYR